MESADRLSLRRAWILLTFGVWLSCASRPPAAPASGPAKAAPASGPAKGVEKEPSAEALPEKDPEAEALLARRRRMIFRRVEDNALAWADGSVFEGPLPPGYVTVAGEQTPASLVKLLRGHRTVFVPGATPGVCTKFVVDSLGPLRADVHDDENVSNECRVRNHTRFEYHAGPFGRASIDMHWAGDPVVLKGCARIGFGIALCGHPVMLIVAIEEDRIGFVETRGHRGYASTFHAYAETARVDWYFDAALCERESRKPKGDGGCG